MVLRLSIARYIAVAYAAGNNDSLRNCFPLRKNTIATLTPYESILYLSFEQNREKCIIWSQE